MKKEYLLFSILILIFTACENSSDHEPKDSALTEIIYSNGDFIKLNYQGNRIESIIKTFDYSYFYNDSADFSNYTRIIIDTILFNYEGDMVENYMINRNVEKMGGDISFERLEYKIERVDSLINILNNDHSNYSTFVFRNNRLIRYYSSEKENIDSSAISFDYSDNGNIIYFKNNEIKKLNFIQYDDKLNPYQVINKNLGFPYFLNPNCLSVNNPIECLRLNLTPDNFESYLPSDTIYYEYQYELNKVINISNRLVKVSRIGDEIITKNEYSKEISFIYSVVDE